MDKELENEDKVLTKVLEAIKSIKYGYVQVIVQDSKVVQIDRTEKTRLDRKWVTDEKGGDRQETKL